MGTYRLNPGAGRDDAQRLQAAVRAGRLVTQVPRWPGLSVDGGAPASMDDIDDEPENTP